MIPFSKVVVLAVEDGDEMAGYVELIVGPIEIKIQTDDEARRLREALEIAFPVMH